MSNPTTLQELADSLAASAHYTHQRQDAAPSAGDGAYLAGYAAALLDTRATVLAMISEQNPGLTFGPGGSIEAHRAKQEAEARRNFHKAEPDDNCQSYSMCKHCGGEIKHLPAGQGWVHEATGMVVGDGPAVTTDTSS